MSTTESRLKALMIAGLSGDAVAYRRCLEETTPYLRGFFRKRLTRLPDEVEDLVQETLLAMHNQRHTYDATQPLTAWLFAIARYKLVDLFRRRAGKEALNDSLEDMTEILTVADTNAGEARRDMDVLLRRLPDRHRLPIVHVKLEGLTVSECARLTGMSESAVKVGVHRGLRALSALIRSDR